LSPAAAAAFARRRKLLQSWCSRVARSLQNVSGMRLLQLTTTLLLSASAFACVAGSDEGRPDDVEQDWRSGGKGDGQTCDFSTMSAATFYEQFDYTTIESETSTSKWYRAGFTWDVQAQLDNGDRASLRVYFLPDDRVIAEYSEQHRIDGQSSEVLNQTVIVTRRVIDPETRTVELVGIGKGTPLTVVNNTRCLPGIQFQHTRDLRSPGLAGDGAQIIAGLTSAYVIDPDRLDEVPSDAARRYFEEDVASGKIKVLRF
jgi:hypothetical protein